jgi:hypothetical protein
MSEWNSEAEKRSVEGRTDLLTPISHQSKMIAKHQQLVGKKPTTAKRDREDE